mmetsp:Transcript_36294/g.94406  ORF Transcript_36294/g.94406 Transcript_36294/m.94406 type:complete len:97 (-) Transcript_36294:136-426(-)
MCLCFSFSIVPPFFVFIFNLSFFSFCSCYRPFEKEVIPAIQSLVEPLNDAIPDPVKDFVDLEDLVGELLSDLVGAVLEESVKKPAEGKMAKIEDGL